jgi:hypothetical protein
VSRERGDDVPVVGNAWVVSVEFDGVIIGGGGEELRMKMGVESEETRG